MFTEISFPTEYHEDVNAFEVKVILSWLIY